MQLAMDAIMQEIRAIATAARFNSIAEDRYDFIELFPR
jgi:hypothetical protein